MKKVKDEQRLCNGCFTLIAPFDPEAFGIGGKWFHCTNCKQKMVDRSCQVYLKTLNLEARNEEIAA